MRRVIDTTQSSRKEPTPRGYQAQIFRCPLLHPPPTGASCAHEQFAKGPGGIK